LLKSYFSRGIYKNERISSSRQKRRERGIWQRRFLAHLLMSQIDGLYSLESGKAWKSESGC
jgi:putative transposase